MHNELEQYINFILRGEGQPPSLRSGPDRKSGDLGKSREILEKIKDPFFLPTCTDLEMCIGPLDEFKRKVITGGLRVQSNDEILEDFKKYLHAGFEDNGVIYELLTVELINAFGSYLISRAKDLGATLDNPITILEVGAGNGRLTHFLSKYFTENADGLIKIIATDSERQRIKPIFPVEKLDHKQGLEKYSPSIVIWSWMPFNFDFTDDFRSNPSVKEYILLGDISVCGLPWETYGVLDPSLPFSRRHNIYNTPINGIALYCTCSGIEIYEPWFRNKLKEMVSPDLFERVIKLLDKKPVSNTFDNENDFIKAKDEWIKKLFALFPPPYKKDGFNMQELDDITSRQIGVGDGWPLCETKSITLSFKRAA